MKLSTTTNLILTLIGLFGIVCCSCWLATESNRDRFTLAVILQIIFWRMSVRATQNEFSNRK